jgi:threonine/homoserine/homoserine lactone efflux protein
MFIEVKYGGIAYMTWLSIKISVVQTTTYKAKHKSYFVVENTL